MASNALKTSLKTDLVEIIKDGLTNRGNYYFFVGRALPFDDLSETANITENDVVVPSIGDTSNNLYSTYRNMLFMKKVQPKNFKIVIPRIDWTYQTEYSAYVDTQDMTGKNYYVMTSEYNVYKCMYSSGKSLVMPTEKSVDVITTSDGYKWKYIYSIPEDYHEFIGLEYIPVFISDPGDSDRREQNLVQHNAKPGSIDFIRFDSSISPTFSKLTVSDLAFTNNNDARLAAIGITAHVAGSSYISFDPTVENAAVGTSYWNDYAIHVVSGDGVGQYFRILNFVKNRASDGNSYFYANISPSIARNLNSVNGSNTQSRFRIVPYIVVDGDGVDATVIPTTTSDKKIRSLVLTSSGRSYTYAKPRIVTEEASIALGGQIKAFNDSISVGLSIPRGHGFNAIKEFGATDLMIIVDIEGSESDKLSTKNDYRQFGLIKDPLLYGGSTLAGFDESSSMKMLLKKQFFKEKNFNDNTFSLGNYIIGKQSKSTARIVGKRSVPGTDFYEISVTDVVGNFVFSNQASLNNRIFYEPSFSGTFVTGDNAFQYSGITGLTLSASGKVLSFDHNERTLMIGCDSGAFVEGKSIFFTAGSTLGSTFIGEIEEEFGELVGQVVIGVTQGSEFLRFDGDENFGRIVSTSLEKYDIRDLGEYSLTTKMVVNTGAMSISNPLDGTLKQVNSGTLRMATATIVEYSVSGNTGTFHLNNLTGTFNTSDRLSYFPYGSTAETQLTTFSINSITNPDIEVGSGDLLYIENIRPIDRNYEQSEEFRIVMGF